MKKSITGRGIQLAYYLKIKTVYTFQTYRILEFGSLVSTKICCTLFSLLLHKYGLFALSNTLKFDEKYNVSFCHHLASVVR
jgi:hypothetical protein